MGRDHAHTDTRPRAPAIFSLLRLSAMISSTTRRAETSKAKRIHISCDPSPQRLWLWIYSQRMDEEIIIEYAFELYICPCVLASLLFAFIYYEYVKTWMCALQRPELFPLLKKNLR
jgi:hypothetical protein